MTVKQKSPTVTLMTRGIPVKLYRAYTAKLKLLGRTVRADILLHLRRTVERGVCELSNYGTSGELQNVWVKGVNIDLQAAYRARLILARRDIKTDLIARMREIVLEGSNGTTETDH